MPGHAVQHLTHSTKDNPVRCWRRYEPLPLADVAAPGYYKRSTLPDMRKGDLVEIFGDDYRAVLKVTAQDPLGQFNTNIQSTDAGNGAFSVKICDAFSVPHQLT